MAGKLWLAKGWAMTSTGGFSMENQRGINECSEYISYGIFL